MSKPDPMDLQAGYAIAALAGALCRQPGIDGQRLRMDFLEILEGLAASPEGVGEVGQHAAALMDVLLQERALVNGQPPPQKR